MKKHPQMFMDLMNEKKGGKFSNEAYRDSSVRMSKKMTFNISSSD
jgi:hypothetical protein